MKDKTIPGPDVKPFNKEEFSENVAKGAIVGATSTTMTFGLFDKPLAIATKASSEVVQHPWRGIKNLFAGALNGNFSTSWNNSLYVQAYRAYLEHPVKGYPVALLNSCLKNVVFFPAKYGSERALYALSGNEQQAKNYSGFVAGLMTVYLTAPVSVVKARLMTNVPLNTLSLKRLGSGVNAIAMRDSIQYGIYFNAKERLNEKIGDGVMAGGIAGIVGYVFSNPLSVIGLNQKTAVESVNIPNMAKRIYQANGVKGFYPLVGLAAWGMFARGVAIHQGTKLYESLQENEAYGRPTRNR
ncbi:hypothetical protein SDA16_03535 [Legionella pneumophila serogroup 1]|uniref:hypothetical protein n=1 Tax=Legionella pneumophila TaxID=446 RepID=UPI000778604F|nr:hypothetical protein [Legionella pneumophila]HCC3236924.1 hypothetical protein [Legionella pneumophila subsp. pneumophila]HAT8622947.1 hypothetical protein [Legionella pneumophila]HAU3903673.1 MC/SLC25 family protein [Legionella pneumophila]HAU3909938.1 MC/SLC25 family protein [Legionella pneumophila]HAU3913190.1 MC/SLC25 family protein [Legionella pneumophila]